MTWRRKLTRVRLVTSRYYQKNWKSFVGNDAAVGGAIGGMFAVQDAARAQGHELELALSIGGWSMSGYFSEVAKTPELRANFVNSVVEFAAAWNDGEQKNDSTESILTGSTQGLVQKEAAVQPAVRMVRTTLLCFNNCEKVWIVTLILKA
ncbi:glycosyl hydrolase family 18 protein [Vibrio sinaloensis]|nr:glycosyl hydrolase family 18 protein [Vibrio sinaloensis]